MYWYVLNTKFVLRSQYIPNTGLVCIGFVLGLYSELGTNVCIGMYSDSIRMYSNVFACMCMNYVSICITLYLLVLYVFKLVCIVHMCLYLDKCVLMCICMYCMYQHVLLVLVHIDSIGAYCMYSNALCTMGMYCLYLLALVCSGMSPYV